LLKDDEAFGSTLDRLSEEVISTLQAGKKLLFAGNGGSAAEAQHMAAEYVNMLTKDRAPLAAIALSVDTSVLTSISNDRHYSEVFSRQVQALGVEGDLLMCYSTSGTSPNVLKAITAAKSAGMKTAMFSGARAPGNQEDIDYLISVPSENTQRIQEAHLLMGHSIAAWVEMKLFPHD
jgi:D-sedoheptulose 7-phosphate isomerase